MSKKYFIGIIFFAVLSCQIDTEARKPTHQSNRLRIISTAPSLTETVYFLGAAKNLVAVTEYCRFPEEVKTLPKIGALFNQNLEQMINLDPDILIHLPSAEENLRGLKKFGIQLVEVRNETIADILKSIHTIGKAVNRDRQADSLVSLLQAKLIPKNGLPGLSAVIIISRQPGTLKEIYVAGPKTFLSQLAEKSGFRNVYGNLNAHYAPVNIESIIANKPAVILDTEMVESDSVYWFRDVETWAGFETIPAVRSKNVIRFRASYTHLPAIRIFDLIHHFSDIRRSINHDQK